MKRLRRIGEQIVSLLFPRHCPLCGILTESSDAPQLCPDCQLLFSAELTVRCTECRCTAPHCRCTPERIAATGQNIGGRNFVTTGFYQPGNASSVCSRMIYTLKTDSDDSAAHILARMLSREILLLFAQNGEDAKNWSITYPPRTKKRRLATGFDQGERLARLLAGYTGAEFVPLLRRRGGEVQKSLRADKRQQNAKESLFLTAPEKCRGRRVLVCDDVLTSGATLAACAELLSAAGADAVFFAASMKTMNPEAPRTPPPKTDWFRE